MRIFEPGHVTCVLAICLLVIVVESSRAQDRSLHRDALDVVVAQMNADLLAGDGRSSIAPEDVRVEPVSITSSILVHRAVHQGVHPFPSYLVATTRGRVWRLGGFEAPELIAAARAFGIRITGPEDAPKIGRLLAQLADPSAAYKVLFPGQPEGWRPEDSDVIRLQMGRLESGDLERLADQSFVRPTGRVGLRLYVLSLHKEWASGYRHLVYSFEFGADGYLEAWSMYERKF